MPFSRSRSSAYMPAVISAPIKLLIPRRIRTLESLPSPSVINLGLEGIMVMGALGGALMMRYAPAGISAFPVQPLFSAGSACPAESGLSPKTALQGSSSPPRVSGRKG